MVRFEDTGTGIANPENLFRPFQRDAQATGLGLYVSRALVKSFGGELVYEASRSRLLLRRGAASGSSLRRRWPMPEPVRNARILLIDDHALFRESVARFLDGEPGFEVVGGCGTVEEARELLRKARSILCCWTSISASGTAWISCGSPKPFGSRAKCCWLLLGLAMPMRQA